MAVFILALHWSLSSARSIQSTPPHPISIRSVLILPPPMSRFSQWSPSFWFSYQRPVCAPLPRVLHALPISSSLTWSIVIIFGEYKWQWPRGHCDRQ
jgi:hypothetical protein